MPRDAVEPRTLSDAAFLRLRADIVSGDLKPGAKLKIGDLISRYEVGASPLREALARLSADHLVVLQGQRGFTVAPISREELLDLARVRQLVETEAVTLSIERGDVEWEARIVAAYFRLQRAQRQAEVTSRWSEAWEDCNRQFHDALVSDCGSVWLLRLQRQLYEQSVRYRYVSFEQPQPPRDGDAEHKALMDACLARDASKARILTAEHIGRTATSVAEMLPSSTTEKPPTRIMQVMSAGDAVEELTPGAASAPRSAASREAGGIRSGDRPKRKQQVKRRVEPKGKKSVRSRS